MSNSDDNKNRIIDFIKKNPSATYRQIRKELKIHPERIFKNGIKEAFQLAKVGLPRTFERKNKDERKEIVLNYIKNHPVSGTAEISQNTGINVANVFRDISEAYGLAGP